MSVVERIKEIERTFKRRSSANAREKNLQAPKPDSKPTQPTQENEPEKIGTFEDLLALDPKTVKSITVLSRGRNKKPTRPSSF
jgi:hypothetical protein